MPSPYDRSPYRPPFTGRAENDVQIHKATVREDEIIVRWTALTHPNTEETEFCLYDISDEKITRTGFMMSLAQVRELHAALGEIIATKEES